MGEFSPTVLPTAAPGFLERVADALSTGVNAKIGFDRMADEDEDRRYQRQQRTNAADDRQRAIDRQTDEDFIHGIRPAGAVDPVTPGSPSSATAGAPPGPRPFATALSEAFNSGATPAVPPMGARPSMGGASSGPRAPMRAPANDGGEGFPDETALAAAMAQQQRSAPATPGAPSAPGTTPPGPISSDSGHPGGWNSVTKTFVSAPLAPVTLPSGRTYDRQGQVDQATALKRSELAAALEEEQAKQLFTADQRRAALQRLKGTPGFETLNDAMIEAGAVNPDVFQKVVEHHQQKWEPTTRAEALGYENDLAEGRAAANERHRSKLSNTLAPALHASVQVSSQLRDTDRAIGAKTKELEKHPMDMALTRADSSFSRNLGDELGKLQARSDSLSGVRDKLNAQVTSAGLGEDYEVPGGARTTPAAAGDRSGTMSGKPAAHATGFPKASQDEYNQAYQNAGGDAAGNVDHGKLARELKKMKRS